MNSMIKLVWRLIFFPHFIVYKLFEIWSTVVECACLVYGRFRVQISKASQILHSVANGSPPL